ncbi:MAG: DNA repair protein RecO [bacterium]|jgi:DNA repair protein RecO (recombination protein O)|nr:DNA repair protein RecO [bacterium]
MPVYREKAIVLRHQDLSGADKIITFLTLGRGKVKAVAKGARRPKSRLAGTLESLSIVEMIYFIQPQRSSLARLNQCELLEPFGNLRSDYDLLIRGLYLAELADTMLKEGSPVPVCFEQLAGALRAMDEGGDGELVRLGCTWRLLAALGYGPSLNACVVCRGENDLAAFNPGLGGCLCEACRTPDRDGLSLSHGAIRHLRLLGELSWQQLRRLKLTAPLKAEIDRVVEAHLNQHLDRRLKSAALLVET